MGFEFLSGDVSNGRKWDRVVEAACFSDVFHTVGYTKVFAEYDGAAPELLVYKEPPYFIALPLLIRRIPTRRDLFDATSVYGYAGPIASHPVEEIPPEVICGFQDVLHRALADRGIVSLFCRLHPLMKQARLIAGLGTGAVTVGETISIDLTLPPEVQWRCFRRNHRQDLKRMEALGVRCEIDRSWAHVAHFIDMYQQSMVRLGADRWYNFNEALFYGIKKHAGEHFHLFNCHYGGDICCGVMVSLYGEVAHCFLSASASKHDRLPAMKLAFDVARKWAQLKGARCLFLGGGVHAKHDSLFHFKAGFSDKRHGFSVWRWVILQKEYADLCVAVGEVEHEDTDIKFPAYRTCEFSTAAQRASAIEPGAPEGSPA